MQLAAAYQQTHSLSQLTQSEDWRLTGAESANIKWTGRILITACRYTSKAL